MHLEAKKAFGESLAKEFYERLTKRNRKPRVFAAKKSSEDRFPNRVAPNIQKQMHPLLWRLVKSARQ